MAWLSRRYVQFLAVAFPKEFWASPVRMWHYNFLSRRQDKRGYGRLCNIMQPERRYGRPSVSESLCASLLPLRVDAARTNRRLVTCNVDKRAHRTYWLEVSGHVDGSRPHQSNSFKTVAQCLAWCRHFHFCNLDIARVFQVLLPQPDSPKAQMSMKMQEQTATML